MDSSDSSNISQYLMSSSPDCLKMSQIPWFEVPLSTDDKAEPHNRLFYSLAERKTHEFYLPQIANHLIIGSSTNSFLICLDDATANLRVINPPTEACFPLPPTSTFSDIVDVNCDPFSGQIASYVVGPSKFRDILSAIRDPTSGEIISYKVGKAPANFTRILDVGHMTSMYFSKAIAIPLADAVTVVVIHKERERLAFAKPGDTSWTAIHCPVDHHFEDIIYHKGRLHAVSNGWTLDVFDISDPSVGPVVYDHNDLSSIQDECDEFDKALHRYLVESPDGEELFLVFGKFGFDDSIGFDVFKLDESRDKWIEVQSLDDLALFIGGGTSLMMFPEPENPVIARNCIYFLEHSEDGGGVAVFNLGDKSIKRLNLNINLQKLNKWPWSVWFTLSVI